MLFRSMPNMDGFTVAEEIRDINPDVPLFFLSAKTMKEDIIQGYKLGADDYITKPFDSEVLLLKIRAILKRNEEMQKEEARTEYDLGKYHFNPRLRELTINGKTLDAAATAKYSDLLPKNQNICLRLVSGDAERVARDKYVCQIDNPKYARYVIPHKLIQVILPDENGSFI